MSVLNGLVLIDKPQGITSHDVVAEVRKILKTKEVGHCGTLDPMATGLLILAIGEGTKLVSSLTEGDKGYQGQIRFGVETDTWDITGQIVNTSSLPSNFESIESLLVSHQGQLDLKVPRHSAIKVGGQKLYEKARREEEFETPLRQMIFKSLEYHSFSGETLDFSFICSKGSYVRSWAQSLCDKLGICGTLSQLRRTYSYPYSLNQAVTLMELKKIVEGEGLENKKFINLKNEFYIPLEKALGDWISLKVFNYDLHLLRHGQISKSLKSQLIRTYQGQANYKAKVIDGNSGFPVALIGLENGKGFFIKRVFR